MSQKLLVVDIGNTEIVLGVYEKNDLLAKWRLDTKLRRTEDELNMVIRQLFEMSNIDRSCVKEAIISCVVPPALPMFINFIRQTFNAEPLVVGPGVKNRCGDISRQSKGGRSGQDRQCGRSSSQI